MTRMYGGRALRESLDSRMVWDAEDLEQLRTLLRAQTGPAPDSWGRAIAAAASEARDPFYAAGVMEYLAHVQWRQGGGRWSVAALDVLSEGMEGEPVEGPEELFAMAMAVPAVSVRAPEGLVWQGYGKADSFQPIDWAALAAKRPPDRPWIVPDWIPARAATLLAGTGGTGKSLLVQQWLSAIAAGVPFLGMPAAEPVRSLYVNCEDDHDELWRRQWHICAALDVQLVHLRAAGLHVLPRMGCDNALGAFDDDGCFVPGELLQRVRSYALAHDIRLVALDNLAHHFPGNENDRALVTAFCSALAGLALELDGAVLLVGHPAKVAGSTFSGSTAWEAAVRQRLYLSRETDGDGNEIEASDFRTLATAKANYTGKGTSVEMVWRAGAFHAADRDAGAGAESAAEAAFLQCLDDCTAKRRHVSHAPSANYAPKVFAGMAAGRRTGNKGLERAMERLFDRGVIAFQVELWRDEKKRRPVFGIARADMLSAAQTPAQTAPKQAAQTAPNHLPKRAPTHPLYPTDIWGGASGAPAPGSDQDGYDWGDDG